MPTINIEQFAYLPLADQKIIKSIVGRGNNLRANKPNDPEGQYVWRLVAFFVSDKPQHHCMPMTHDFGLFDIAPKVTSYNEFRKRDVTGPDHAWIKNRKSELDKLVDLVVDSIPVNQRHGVNRWARAYGVI